MRGLNPGGRTYPLIVVVGSEETLRYEFFASEDVLSFSVRGDFPCWLSEERQHLFSQEGSLIPP